MACNCATKEEIDKLYEMYGDKKRLPEKPKFKDYFRYYVGNATVYILGLVALPLLILYILVLLFWREDEKLHVKDFDIYKKLRIVK